MWLNLQVLPLCSDSQPDSRCVRAPPPPWEWRAVQSLQISTLTLSQHHPACWQFVLILLLACSSSHYYLARHVGMAQQAAPPAGDGAVQQSSTAVRPAEEQLWYLHPPGPAGDLPYWARLCRGLRPGLLHPVHPNYNQPLAQTQAVTSGYMFEGSEEQQGQLRSVSIGLTHWSIWGKLTADALWSVWNSGMASKSFTYPQNKRKLVSTRTIDTHLTQVHTELQWCDAAF